MVVWAQRAEAGPSARSSGRTWQPPTPRTRRRHWIRPRAEITWSGSVTASGCWARIDFKAGKLQGNGEPKSLWSSTGRVRRTREGLAKRMAAALVSENAPLWQFWRPHHQHRKTESQNSQTFELLTPPGLK